MNPANLTAAERDTILAALLFFAERLERNAVPIHLVEIAKQHGSALTLSQVDALSERLITPPTPRGSWVHDICEDGSEGISNPSEGIYIPVSRKLSSDTIERTLTALNAQPPQAPEPTAIASERDNYKRAVDEAHAVLDACELMTPRSISHGGLRQRVEKLIQIATQKAPEPVNAELLRDKAILDVLERRGVQSIYFNDGSQINPASQSLRDAMSREVT